MLNLFVLSLCLFSVPACAHSFADTAKTKSDRVERDLNMYDKHIAERRAEFAKIPENINNKHWVKKKLAFMVEIDQYMRNYLNTPHTSNYTDEETRRFQFEFGPRFEAIDKPNTASMKRLIAKYKWFTISEFGEEADQNAWLLVQHADLDIQFQKEVLKILEKLWGPGETNPANYAYLFDRVAASYSDTTQQTPQRYGTQGMCVGPGKWQPLKMEDPTNIDVRRKAVGLNTLQEYIGVFKNICK